MGKPVALDASADERDTRGFISTTTNWNGLSPFASGGGLGLTANWTLLPPVSTPTPRITAKAASRRAWYSLSVSVRMGATVMESPVCTPIGSIFSMPQITMQLSLRSRTTSSSNSFHPMSDSSIWTCVIIDAASPRETSSLYSSVLYAIPPPVPPSVNAGRMIAGSPISSRKAMACPSDSTRRAWGVFSPARSQTPWNCSRSSARWMTSRVAPIISIWCFASVPSSCRAQAQLSAVCPPSVDRMASMPSPCSHSFSMILRTPSGVMGSI